MVQSAFLPGHCRNLRTGEKIMALDTVKWLKQIFQNTCNKCNFKQDSKECNQTDDCLLIRSSKRLQKEEGQNVRRVD